MTDIPLNKRLEHTLLRADATRSDLEKLCEEARTYKLRGICVSSFWIPTVKKILNSSDVLCISVVGFPLGNSSTETKAAETKYLVQEGTDEIDMVLNIGALKSKDHDAVFQDIAGVVRAAGTKPVKVILETSYLSDEEKRTAAQLAIKAKASFVKTSTGFTSSGAKVEDILLLRETVKNQMKIKASGGIRDKSFADALIKAGADTLGTSQSVSILSGQTVAQGSY